MTEKTCFKCGIMKPLDEFYTHAMMADGHLNKCKSCTKRDVRLHRSNSDSVREYDRQRAKLSHRRENSRKITERWNKNNPLGYRARYLTNNAVRDGRLKRQPCEVCGSEKVHAHHRDYSKPLDVIWLCARHHHKMHGLSRRLP